MIPDLFRNDEAGREAFRTLAFRIVEWVTAYYRSVDALPVRSQVRPGEILAASPGSAPERPVPADDLFRFLDEVILPGMTHWQHPRFFAFFPGNTSFPSIAGEMLTAGMAAQCMLWESSPAAAELEQCTVGWCRELLGLPAAWEGVIQDTASTATLTALLTAREWKSGFRIATAGFGGQVYRIYASDQAHSSVEKAVRLAGFGTDNLVRVPVDENLALRPDALEALIREDEARGYTPVAVVSTLGTTATGAVDPIAAISGITERHGLWHHVDAAYLGTALMLEEYGHLRDGLEGVDSFVFNPHKWMFVQFDCSLYYVRSADRLVRAMGINPSYLMTAHGNRVRDYRDWGIPLGRRFRALKLWLTLSLLGTDAIRERLRHHIRLGARVEAWIGAHPMLEKAYPRMMNVNSFRIRPDLDPQGERTRALGKAVNDAGFAYMTHAVVESCSLLRWVTGQTYTEIGHVEETFAHIDQTLTAIDRP